VPLAKPSLLWRQLSDRVQALAWHPTNPRVSAAEPCVRARVCLCSWTAWWATLHDHTQMLALSLCARCCCCRRRRVAGVWLCGWHAGSV
jgi:hypothetical protein